LAQNLTSAMGRISIDDLRKIEILSLIHIFLSLELTMSIPYRDWSPETGISKAFGW